MGTDHYAGWYSTARATLVTTVKKNCVIFEVAGGSDKGPDGFRKDTLPIVDSLRKRGWTAEVIFYTHEKKDAIYKHVLMTADVFVHRINPGNLKNEGPYFDMLRELANNGIVALPHPDAMLRYGAKDALSKLKGTKYALDDTQAYYTIDDFKECFPKMLATGERVLKQNRGSTGEGIWRVQCLGDCDGKTSVPMDCKVKCTEAKDNHVEEHTLGEFMKFCEQYIQGENGMLIDQRFLPRIMEGEVRVVTGTHLRVHIGGTTVIKSWAPLGTKHMLEICGVVVMYGPYQA
eukprot:1195374-Prorocentrum_minimum.AAC.6